jgi:hypothetical protein
MAIAELEIAVCVSRLRPRSLNRSWTRIAALPNPSGTADPQTRQRCVDNERQAFAGEVVDDDQNAEAATFDECIGHEVDAPALVGSLRDRQRRSGAECALAARAPAHLQPLLALEATKLLVIHDQTLAAHQHEQTAITEPAADRRQLA